MLPFPHLGLLLERDPWSVRVAEWYLLKSLKRCGIYQETFNPRDGHLDEGCYERIGRPTPQNIGGGRVTGRWVTLNSHAVSNTALMLSIPSLLQQAFQGRESLGLRPEFSDK